MKYLLITLILLSGCTKKNSNSSEVEEELDCLVYSVETGECLQW